MRTVCTSKGISFIYLFIFILRNFGSASSVFHSFKIFQTALQAENRFRVFRRFPNAKFAVCCFSLSFHFSFWPNGAHKYAMILIQTRGALECHFINKLRECV